MLCCQAGCDYRDVLAALHLTARDLFDDDAMRDIYNPRRDYTYPDGRVVQRKPDKTFPQSGNKDGNALFQASNVAEAQTVFVTEGEKDSEAIAAIGGAAVSPPQGAGKAHLFDWSPLTGKTVIIVADNDDPGRKQAAEVTALLAWPGRSGSRWSAPSGGRVRSAQDPGGPRRYSHDRERLFGNADLRANRHPHR